MTLCSLCQSISFEQLPELLPTWSDHGDGFLVFTPARSGKIIYLISAIGLCAEDGTYGTIGPKVYRNSVLIGTLKTHH
jgi:hypothetical protein